MIVIQKRPKINPYSIFFKSMIDCIDIVKNIVGCIKEKTTCNSFKSLLLFFVNIGKLSSYDCEIKVFLSLKFNYWTYVRNFDCSILILFIVVVLGWTYERSNSKLFLFLWAIDDEVRGKKHEVSDLISLCWKSCLYKFEDKSSKSTTWN